MTYQPESKDSAEENVSALIEELQSDILYGAFSIVNGIKSGTKLSQEDLEKQKALTYQFKVIKNTYIGYLQLKKAGGKVNPSNLTDMVNKIKEMKSNIGNIVSSVPKE